MQVDLAILTGRGTESFTGHNLLFITAEKLDIGPQ
jgi:hypothetical protein